MKKLLTVLILFGFVLQAYTQEPAVQHLPEVLIYATNYKYLDNVGGEDVDLTVSLLEKKVANFDKDDLQLYDDEYGIYKISFYIPDGKILAAYDKNGKVLRTIEKFKNVKLPANVRNAVMKRFPGWTFYKDVYLVNYDQNKGTKKMYKITLQNKDKKLKVRTDEEGNFL